MRRAVRRYADEELAAALLRRHRAVAAHAVGPTVPERADRRRVGHETPSAAVLGARCRPEGAHRPSCTEAEHEAFGNDVGCAPKSCLRAELGEQHPRGDLGLHTVTPSHHAAASRRFGEALEVQ